MNGPDATLAALPELVPLSGPARSRTTSATTSVAWPNVVVPADAQADAEIRIDDRMVRVHALFQVDPRTQEIHVSVVDDEGHLIRLIPPDSVAQMLRAMAAYPTAP